jgi:hypothetical protein
MGAGPWWAWSLLVLALAQTVTQAAFKSQLQGQDSGSTTWGNGPLLGWQELDFIPMRTYFTGGPISNELT